MKSNRLKAILETKDTLVPQSRGNYADAFEWPKYISCIVILINFVSQH